VGQLERLLLLPSGKIRDSLLSAFAVFTFAFLPRASCSSDFIA
jgi:hypothetical protein